jgi:hypothetical protein
MLEETPQNAMEGELKRRERDKLMYGGEAKTNARDECGAMTIGGQSIRERVRNDARRSKVASKEEAVKADQLSRLSYLLDKNPEVADILDLMEKLNLK